MENDRLNIDKLFRENLASREVPPSEADWSAIEKSLDAGNGSSGNMTGWIMGALVVLVSAGVFFFMTHHSSQTQSSNTPNQSSSMSSKQDIHSKTPTDASSGNSAAEFINAPSSNTNHNASNHTDNPKEQQANTNSLSDNPDNPDPSTARSSFSSSEEISANTSSDNSFVNSSTQAIATQRRETDNMTTGQNAEIKGKKISSKKASSSNGTSASETMLTNQEIGNTNDQSTTSAQQVHNNSQDQINQSDSRNIASSSHQQNPSALISPAEIPLMKALQMRKGTLSLREAEHKSGKRILPENESTLSGWSCGLSLFGGFVNSSIEESSDLLAKRNNEELGTLHGGVLLDAGYKKGRSQFVFGVGFEKTGEDIQYDDEIVRQVNYTTTELQEYMHTETILDSVWNDTTWVIISTDTTYLDTMYVQVENEKDTIVHDKSITARNGVTTIQNIIIPLSLRYDIFQFNERAELFVSGSVQLEYAIRRKAHYLDDETRTLKDIENLTTYRTINTSAALGVGMRLHHTKRLMTVAEMYGRTNLFSWNTDFTHRYYSFGLRLGIGYNF